MLEAVHKGRPHSGG